MLDFASRSIQAQTEFSVKLSSVAVNSVMIWNDKTHADFQSVLYVSTSLRVVVLEWPPGVRQKPPEAFWNRCQVNGEVERQIVYQLTPEVLRWILCKAETTDHKWTAAMRPGAKGIDLETQQAMRTLGDRLQNVLTVAREFGIVAAPAQTTPGVEGGRKSRNFRRRRCLCKNCSMQTGANRLPTANSYGRSPTLALRKPNEQKATNICPNFVSKKWFANARATSVLIVVAAKKNLGKRCTSIVLCQTARIRSLAALRFAILAT